tara:strand:- start:378 stop:1145 length:768 start_codon:yes stop_codon:yes gene_type:complete
MLKKRIIPVLLLKDGKMVKGKKFRNYIDTGNPESAVDIYSSQDADELVFLNISQNKDYFIEFKNIIKVASKKCSMPMTVGGNIKNLEDVREMLMICADKIIITSEIVDNFSLINEVAYNFGSQCMIVGIDYSFDKSENKYFVWKNLFQNKTKYELFEYIDVIKKYNFGELFLNSVDRDGMMAGYDIEIIKKVKSLINVPIIACGGAGNFQHIEELFKNTKISAAACSSIFHFGDNNPIRARTHLKNRGILMRNLK